MDCEAIEREETLERYLTGRLTAQEREEFESHCFACSSCLDRLEVLRAVQEELWEQGRPPVPEEASRPPLWSRRWALASLAALALVVIGAVLWRTIAMAPRGRSASGPAPSAWAALAEFEPPAYLALALRGGSDEAAERFRTGMEHYTAGRYERAIRDLRAAESRSPQASHIPFFLGVSYLLTGKTDKGISRLERAVSLGDPSYAAEARFYLAKAWLRKGNAGRARVELEAVVSSGSRLADEAARLLSAMGKAPSR